MKNCFFVALIICGLVAFAAIADAAGPLGIFGNRVSGGSCANGQCTVPTAVVTTAPATPTATGIGQAATSSAAAAACANGSCGQSAAKRVGPVRRFFQRFRR